MPDSFFPALTALLRAGPVCLVRVVETAGSVPREAGTWMAVGTTGLWGTIGGGHLEWQAIQLARERLAQAAPDALRRRYALGPSLGQCCGGAVVLRFEPLLATQLAALRAQLQAGWQPLALFGGGHVGQAIVDVLNGLPFALRWIDSRDGIFPPAHERPPHVQCEHSDPVHAAVADLAPGSSVLIMSFSHAEDLDVVAACLMRLRARNDLPFVGLIGSQTKWASFRRRLEQRGFTADELARVTCPIGVPGIRGKEPRVIAVAVAAQLLQGVGSG